MLNITSEMFAKFSAVFGWNSAANVNDIMSYKYLVRLSLSSSHWPLANTLPLHLSPHLSDDSESVSQLPENVEDDVGEAHFLTAPPYNPSSI